MKRDPLNYNSDTLFEGQKPEYDLKDALPLKVKKGTLIFFDGNLVHFSKENNSNKPRHALTMHFVENNQQYKWDPRNWIQRDPNVLPFRNFYKTC
jgi:phytanoyl-CoA hydroxylase